MKLCEEKGLNQTFFISHAKHKSEVTTKSNIVFLSLSINVFGRQNDSFCSFYGYFNWVSATLFQFITELDICIYVQLFDRNLV